MIARARLAAYAVLRELTTGRADLASALADAREGLPDERDRALASEIAIGVQRSRAALDYVIHKLAARPLDKLDSEVLDVLRLSAYQLLYLTRVPPSAVVDDGVSLTGRAGKRSAAGLVNAVLRRLSREAESESLRLPARPPDVRDREVALEYLSVTLSHPRWLAARWYDRLGFDRAEQWMVFNNRQAPVTLRPYLERLTVAELETRLAGEGIRTHRGRYAPTALVVDEGQPLHHGPTPADRMFLVQDEGSQLVPLLTGDHPAPPILDTCASPGGKATAIAAATHGMVVACDVRERRVALLSETVRQAGARNIRIVQADLEEGLPFAQRFATVIVDAPCSGLGTLRRDPDIRWNRKEEDLAAFATRQRRMLRHAAAVVATGGRLVYATCSSEPEENEAVAQAFLTDSPEFAPLDARRVHPEMPAEIVDERGHLRTAPDAHGLECFFGAVFERSRHL
jgi:16S rRNA (cytosine967-C5)-methyltransferase